MARLNRLGIDLYLERFAEISAEHDGRGLVLLCFESAGAFCHRRVPARWLEEQTGQEGSRTDSHLRRAVAVARSTLGKWRTAAATPIRPNVIRRS